MTITNHNITMIDADAPQQSAVISHVILNAENESLGPATIDGDSRTDWSLANGPGIDVVDLGGSLGKFFRLGSIFESQSAGGQLWCYRGGDSKPNCHGIDLTEGRKVGVQWVEYFPASFNFAANPGLKYKHHRTADPSGQGRSNYFRVKSGGASGGAFSQTIMLIDDIEHFSAAGQASGRQQRQFVSAPAFTPATLQWYQWVKTYSSDLLVAKDQIWTAPIGTANGTLILDQSQGVGYSLREANIPGPGYRFNHWYDVNFWNRTSSGNSAPGVPVTQFWYSKSIAVSSDIDDPDTPFKGVYIDPANMTLRADSGA